ncbi:MAG: DNA-processing protein DprA [Planctomycetaceae bacterium]|nr:DNA-processing protein DprA [Planctomycetaceae bacterium]
MDNQPFEGTDAPSGARVEEHEAMLRLVLVDGIGAARLQMLRERFGSARAALAARPVEFAAAIRTREADAQRMLSEAHAADPTAELDRVRAAGAVVLAAGEPSYPSLLVPTPDPPALLFVRGELGPVPEPAVAIVGSRRASAYGMVEAGRIAESLASRGVTVISGGARGIDAEAHRGALRAGGRTVAVLASGLGQPYPPEHAPLFEQIVSQGGAIVTEQPYGVRPRADLFPRRNRIVAGLSLVVVVIEAASRSGALLTARIAVDDLSRDAACLPGRVDSAVSAGCHRAIREGWAQLVTGADDIMQLVDEARPLVAAAMPREAFEQPADARAAPAPLPEPRAQEPDRATVRSLGPDAAEILSVLGSTGAAGLDELERTTAWMVPRIAMATLELEVKGLVRRDAGGAYVALRGRGW